MLTMFQELLFSFISFTIGFLVGKEMTKSRFIYGFDSKDNRLLRKNRRTGAVEFLLWKIGDQKNVDGIGHTKNIWHMMANTHWERFRSYE